MATALPLLTAVAAVGAGLVAGLFWFCSIALMPGLARIPAAAGIAAMQAINVAIVRAGFLAVFMGTAVAVGLLAVLAPDPLRLVAAAAYLVGVIGVTGVVNVPLNNALAAVAAGGAEGERFWRHYRSRWSAWNHLRAAAAAVASTALVLAP